MSFTLYWFDCIFFVRVSHKVYSLCLWPGTECFFCKFSKGLRQSSKCLQESISIHYVNVVFQLHDVFMDSVIFQLMEEFSLISLGRETIRSGQGQGIGLSAYDSAFLTQHCAPQKGLAPAQTHFFVQLFEQLCFLSKWLSCGWQFCPEFWLLLLQRWMEWYCLRN